MQNLSIMLLWHDLVIAIYLKETNLVALELIRLLLISAHKTAKSRRTTIRPTLLSVTTSLKTNVFQCNCKEVQPCNVQFFLPQNAPETVWRPGSARTRWGNLKHLQGPQI